MTDGDTMSGSNTQYSKNKTKSHHGCPRTVTIEAPIMDSVVQALGASHPTLCDVRREWQVELCSLHNPVRGDPVSYSCLYAMRGCNNFLQDHFAFYFLPPMQNIREYLIFRISR
jgi:hypothetical protein